jgi:hypothetical protein
MSAGQGHETSFAQIVSECIKQPEWLRLHRSVQRHLEQQLVLTLDGAYEYTSADLAHWDIDGPGSTFKKYYSKYYDLALSYGLDPTLKPTKLDISETVRWLGYKPSYSLANLLSDLATYGDSGPPQFTLTTGGPCGSSSAVHGQGG